MAENAFQDSALLLIAHGSTLNAGSSAPAFQHADELRRRVIFASVSEAFVQQEPSLPGALRRILAPRIFVVPFFISEGWFTETAVPVQLGLRAPDSVEFQRTQVRHGQVIH
jgi:sirohydrochlorin cobaltochelatase